MFAARSRTLAIWTAGAAILAVLAVGTRDVVGQAGSWTQPASGWRPAAPPSIRVGSGPSGRGSLARRLPTTTPAGWRLSLLQIDARAGAYVVLTLPPPGHRTTGRSAARELATAARAVHDDPSAYRPVVPMSALEGAR